MADTRKFYWLKLKDTFFDDKLVKALRKLPDGNGLIIVYLKMQLKSLKTNGLLKYDEILPSCDEELSLVLDEDINLVKLTISALEKMKAIELLDDNSIYMLAMQDLIGKEGSSAERVRRFREKNDTKMLPSNTNVTKCNAERREKRKENKKEETEIRNKISNKLLNDFFESVWLLYPKKEGKGSVSASKKKELYKIGYDRMVRTIEQYQKKIACENIEPKFIKLGSTFFNSGYVDYLDCDYVPVKTKGKVDITDTTRYDGKDDGSFE